jgi:hypothetical protein
MVKDMRIQRPLTVCFGVSVVSFAVGASWFGITAARGSGYWSWPISWWGLALIWGICAAMVAGAVQLRLALPVGLVAAAMSVTGGAAILFTLLAIYGTGD